MNRLKKEEKRKYEQARKGLNEDEILAVDLEDEIDKKIKKLAKSMHASKFPEEYDFMYDSRVDGKDRSKGINPMCQDYIDEVTKRRLKLGVEPLLENGTLASNETYKLCLEQAKLKVYSDIELKRPPAKTCIFCNKTLSEVGGKRLVAQMPLGTKLTHEKPENNSEYFPHQCVELFSDPLVYLDYWGARTVWTNSAIEAAKKAYLNGKQPWFCQPCGWQSCRECGSLLNYPMEADVLHGDGRINYVSETLVTPGCSNTDCKNYEN